MNNDDCFKEHVELIWKILEDDPTLKSETITATDSFVRVSIIKDDVILKLDFVNDINYHIGDIHSSDLFHKIDSLENILTNKISALSRSEAKDIVDIYFIVKHYNFDWKEIIRKAQKKDGWVDPLNIAQLLDTFPVNQLDEINWITQVEHMNFTQEIQSFKRDIVEGNNNSHFIQ